MGEVAKDFKKSFIYCSILPVASLFLSSFVSKFLEFVQTSLRKLSFAFMGTLPFHNPLEQEY